MMEKRNVVAADRTPVHEFKDINGDWDKVAVAMFDLSDVDEATHVKNVDSCDRDILATSTSRTSSTRFT